MTAWVVQVIHDGMETDTEPFGVPIDRTQMRYMGYRLRIADEVGRQFLLIAERMYGKPTTDIQARE